MNKHIWKESFCRNFANTYNIKCLICEICSLVVCKYYDDYDIVPDIREIKSNSNIYQCMFGYLICDYSFKNFPIKIFNPTVFISCNEKIIKDIIE
jgi:hypothetical protein